MLEKNVFFSIAKKNAKRTLTQIFLLKDEIHGCVWHRIFPQTAYTRIQDGFYSTLLLIDFANSIMNNNHSAFAQIYVIS